MLAAAALAPAVRALAHRWGVLDRPSTALKTHAAPVAYLGGAAVFLGFAVAMLATRAIEATLFAAAPELGRPAWADLVVAEFGPQVSRERLLFEALTLKGLRGVAAGGAILLAVGLLDDVRPLTPPAKLALQTAAALLVVATGKHIRFIEPLWIALPLTVVWIVGVTNAFNFIDIQNGLAAGVAAIACAAFFAIGSLTGKFYDMTLAAALFGALLGFLPFNFPRATIFLGDAGSLFLGFTCASIAIGETYSRVNPVAVVSPLLILVVPIFDTLFTMAMRVRARRPVTHGSPDHVALRLTRMGVPAPAATAVLWGASLGGAALAFVSCQLTAGGAVVLYLAAGIPIGVAALRLGRRRLDPPGG